MNNKLIAINYRLNRLDEAKKKRLALGLPKEEGAFLEKLPKFQEISSLSFESKEELINRIHPSWLKKKKLTRRAVTPSIQKGCE